MNSKILYSLSVIFYHCTAHCTHCSLKKPTDKLKKTNWQTDCMRRRSLTRQFLYEGCQKSSKCFRFHITAIPCSGIFGCANWSPIHSAKSWQRSPSESHLHSRLCAQILFSQQQLKLSARKTAKDCVLKLCAQMLFSQQPWPLKLSAWKMLQRIQYVRIKSCDWNLDARISLNFLALVLSPSTLLSCSMPEMSDFEFSIQEHWQALV